MTDIEPDERPVTVYALSSSEDGEVRYIGQTVEPEKRLGAHIRTAKRANTYKRRWALKVLKSGHEIQMVILVENAVWNVDEIRLIAEYRKDGARLTNSTDGGEGLLGASAETKAKLAAAALGNTHSLGRKHTDEAKEKMRNVAMGHTRNQSPEYREKMSKAMAGKTLRKPRRKISEEARANMSKAQKGLGLGRKHTDEAKEKMSKALLGRKPTDKARANMSKAKMGHTRNQSPETREKMSKAQMGHTHTNESKEKMGKAKMGNSYRRGTKTSDAGRANMSKAQKGLALGRKHTDEAKEKMSKALLGRKASPEARENNRAAQLKRFAREREALKPGTQLSLF